MWIPFSKAHGARNDFLLTWNEPPLPLGDLPPIARAICDRHTGVGADGWMLVDDRPGIRLFNSDGSEPELSGNGTRCAAAFLIVAGFTGDHIEIATGAGPKQLRLLRRNGLYFEFEMNMGRPKLLADHFSFEKRQTTVDAMWIDCGNPQCAIPVDNFDFDWQALGAEVERHPQFPNRTNVSFLRPVDDHTIDVRFFERGAGETMSSGTGSTGAAFCAITRGIAVSPVTVLTPAGPLVLEDRGSFYLLGPAEITAEGRFHYDVGDAHH